MIEEPQLCECGCGESVAKAGNRFINGHNRRGIRASPESLLKMSKSQKARMPPTDKTRKKMSETKKRLDKEHPENRQVHSEFMIKVHSDQCHRDEQSRTMKNSEAAKIAAEKQRGGEDIVTHHYIYDESDLSLNTVQMTRSDHMKLHWLLRKLGYKVSHINMKEE